MTVKRPPPDTGFDAEGYCRSWPCAFDHAHRPDRYPPGSTMVTDEEQRARREGRPWPPAKDWIIETLVVGGMLPERVVGRPPLGGGEVICPEADPDDHFAVHDFMVDVGRNRVLWRGADQWPHHIVASYYNGSVFACACGATFALGDAKTWPGHMRRAA